LALAGQQQIDQPQPHIYLNRFFNIFRSRAIGYWWSQNGIQVIPNVRWGDQRSYDFCFDGLPRNSVIAVGSHGCTKRIEDKRHYFNGFMKMLEAIDPKTVLIYGSASHKIIPPLFAGNIEIIRFESDFSVSRR
jgi:hypothetical protein